MLPLLFSEAFHATVDAPTAVREAQEATGVSLRLGGILGMGEDVLLALEDSAARAHISAHEAILLLAVGSSRDEANAAVHELAERWSLRRLGPGVGRLRHHRRTAGHRLLERATAQRRRIGVVPLFLAPGLLLDATAQAGDVDRRRGRPAAGYRAGRPGVAAVRRGAGRGTQFVAAPRATAAQGLYDRRVRR